MCVQGAYFIDIAALLAHQDGVFTKQNIQWSLVVSNTMCPIRVQLANVYKAITAHDFTDKNGPAMWTT